VSTGNYRNSKASVSNIIRSTSSEVSDEGLRILNNPATVSKLEEEVARLMKRNWELEGLLKDRTTHV
jgi:hypothetical protein